MDKTDAHPIDAMHGTEDAMASDDKPWPLIATRGLSADNLWMRAVSYREWLAHFHLQDDRQIALRETQPQAICIDQV